MPAVNMLQAKTKFSRPVERLEQGTEREFVIACNGRPATRLVPFGQAHAQQKRLGVAKGRFVAPDDIDWGACDTPVSGAQAKAWPEQSGYPLLNIEAPDVLGVAKLPALHNAPVDQPLVRRLWLNHCASSHTARKLPATATPSSPSDCPHSALPANTPVPIITPRPDAHRLERLRALYPQPIEAAPDGADWDATGNLLIKGGKLGLAARRP